MAQRVGADPSWWYIWDYQSDPMHDTCDGVHKSDGRYVAYVSSNGTAVND